MGSFSIHNCRAISNHQRGGVQDYQHAGQVVQVCLRCWKRGLHSHSPHCDGPVCPQPSPNISTLALRIEELWRQKDTRRHVLPSGHQDTRASCICPQSLEADLRRSALATQDSGSATQQCTQMGITTRTQPFPKPVSSSGDLSAVPGFSQVTRTGTGGGLIIPVVLFFIFPVLTPLLTPFPLFLVFLPQSLL